MANNVTSYITRPEKMYDDIKDGTLNILDNIDDAEIVMRVVADPDLKYIFNYGSGHLWLNQKAKIWLDQYKSIGGANADPDDLDSLDYHMDGTMQSFEADVLDALESRYLNNTESGKFASKRKRNTPKTVAICKKCSVHEDASQRTYNDFNRIIDDANQDLREIERDAYRATGYIGSYTDLGDKIRDLLTQIKGGYSTIRNNEVTRSISDQGIAEILSPKQQSEIKERIQEYDKYADDVFASIPKAYLPRIYKTLNFHIDDLYSQMFAYPDGFSFAGLQQEFKKIKGYIKEVLSFIDDHLKYVDTSFIEPIKDALMHDIPEKMTRDYMDDFIEKHKLFQGEE